MKINKYDESVFLDFASREIGVDVRMFRPDMNFVKTEKCVKLTFYVGGESLDLRKFIFCDDDCEFIHGGFNNNKDLSREWVMYLSEEVCESDDEANFFIDKYNDKLETQIKEYSKAKRNLRIVL